MADESILAAVSGIDANQTYLDSIANNIANANTVGYKDQTLQFQDLLAEQIQGASAPSAGNAGVNPLAVGSGVRVSSSEVDLSEGSLEQTGQATDVAIQGDGYLVVDQGGQSNYTRDGNLTVDGNGDLATQSGGLIQGWMANSSGVISTGGATTAIQIPNGESVPAEATTSITLGGNLPAWDGTGTAPVVTAPISAYDSLGDVVPVTLTFTGVTGAANEWTMSGTVTNPDGTTSQLWSTNPTVTFDPTTGEMKSVTGSTTQSDGSLTVPVGTMPSKYSFPTSDTWNIDFPAPTAQNAVTQFAGRSTIQVESQDGHASGTLQSYSIGTNGVIEGSFSNGTTLDIGQIALATFTNPSGLSDTGGGLYAATSNSGQANVATAGSGSAGGTLLGGELEQSNVNLGSELTSLIGAQEAYEANTKVLTSDQAVIQALESVA